MTEPTLHSDPIRSSVSFGVTAVHLAAYLLLVFRSPYLQGTYSFIAVGFLLSQCSLATILAMRGSVPPTIAIALPWVAAVGCWYGLSKTLFWGLGEPGAAWWAIAIAFQVVATIVGMRVFQVAARRASKQDSANHTGTSTTFQFPIRSLILWTTLAALGFAIIVMGQRNRVWSGNSIVAAESVMMSLVGAMLAMIGVLCDIALAQKRAGHVCLGLLSVILCVGLCSWLLPRGSLWAGLDVTLDAFSAMMTLFSTHAICTAVTLAFIWRSQEAKLTPLTGQEGC